MTAKSYTSLTMRPLSSKPVYGSRQNASILVRKCLTVENAFVRIELRSEDSLMNLAEWVTYQRLRHGWMKADLVRESGVSRQILHEIEAGTRTYDRGSAILSRIEKAFEAEYDPNFTPTAGSALSGWVVDNPKLLGRVVAALIQLDEEQVKEIADGAEDELAECHNDGNGAAPHSSAGRRSRPRGKAS